MIQKSKICFIYQMKSFLLDTPVQNTLQSSDSFIISLAQQLTSNLKLYPESIILYRQITNNKETQTNQGFILRPCEDYLQIWCDYLFSLMSDNEIIIAQDQIVFISKVSSVKYTQLIKNTQNFAEIDLWGGSLDSKQLILQKFLPGKKQQTRIQKKSNIAIINFSASAIECDKTKAKINLDSLFAGIFYQNGDNWKSYKIIKGEIPTPPQILTYDSIILTGSSYSVNNMPQNIKVFVQNLLIALKMNSQLKVMASCFGHQLISYALGMKVQKRKQMKNLQNLTFNFSQVANISYFNHLSKINGNSIRVYEYHSDYVTEVPQGFKRIAFSKGCENQMFVSHDFRIITFQFHPQYSQEYISWLEKRWHKEADTNRSQVKPSYDLQHHHSLRLIRNTILQFLHQ